VQLLALIAVLAMAASAGLLVWRPGDTFTVRWQA